MNRNDQLKDFANKMKSLEDEYKVKLSSDNGWTNTLVIDEVTGDGYHYESGELNYFHG